MRCGGAQIIAVADAFDAMTSDRPYRKGMPLEKVVAVFEKERGTQWATDVVDAFLGSSDLLEKFADRSSRAEAAAAEASTA